MVLGQHREGVYCWLTMIPLRSSTLVLSSLATSSFSAISMWHSRLSNPSLHIFHKFLIVPKEHLCSFSCTSRNINKSHKLPFAKSSIITSFALDVIFSNVLTSHVSFFYGFNYYVIFVDHCTKYIWLYPSC